MIRAFFDGSCELTRGKWGAVSCGAIIYRDSEVLWEHSKTHDLVPGQGTSGNVAEYLGLIAVLDYMKETALHLEPSIIYGDSALVINQMCYKWRIKTGEYVQYAIHARDLVSSFKTPPNFRWIPRDQNAIADRLSKPQARRP